MSEVDDHELLVRYARENSQTAFTTLVDRYVNLVYSVALRITNDQHVTEEIAQAVFIILAKKAGTISSKVVLSGWLYHTTRLTAANYLRSEIRRHKREQEACVQSLSNEAETWQRIAPLLEDAMGRLADKERDVVVLRFFENKSLREVGLALGASEDAAKMRVNRALEKLRKILGKRGVVLSTVAIAGAVSTHSVQAAPLTLTKAISAVAVVKGVTAGGSTLTLVKGALKVMAWIKAKTVITSGVVLLLAAGVTTVTVKEITTPRGEVWRKKYDLSLLEHLPPQVKILSAIPSRPGSSWGNNSFGMMGLGVGAQDIVQSAYGNTLGRMIISASLPEGRYDFISNLPQGGGDALQQEIKKEFGLVARRELIETNILVLTVRDHDAAGLHLSSTKASDAFSNRNRGTGSYDCKSMPLSNLVGFLEDYLGTPVVDQTGLTGRYDIVLIGDATREGLKRAVLKELGLELVADNKPIEFLMVEQAEN